MAAPNHDLQVDYLSPLSHKAALDTGAGTLHTAPSWVPETEQRRLAAYRIRASYLGNVARLLLDADNDDDRKKRREYGDAALLVARTVSGVLGDTLTIAVDGADTDLGDTPDLPDQPDDPDETATELDKRIAAIRKARWDQTATEIVDAWEKALTEQPALQARQEWLEQWADDEFLHGKIVEAETDVAGLADGVYTLDWSNTDGRPIVEVFDPGFYFPVLTDTTRGFPTKVHMAWEFEVTEPDGRKSKFVRRRTWELAPIALGMFDDELGDYIRDDDGNVIFADGDTVDADGRVVRRYPWQPEDEDPSPITCLFTDATWKLEDLGPRHVDDLDASKATYAITDDGQFARRLDKRINFLPVIHIPNTPASRDHFGTAVIDLVLQVLDDIHLSDTDLQLAAKLAASPMAALFGATADNMAIRPGTVIGVPNPEGSMEVIDLTTGLSNLQSINEGLRDTLSVNSRIPAEVLGRVKAQAGLPGITVRLLLGPFEQLIDVLRLTRVPKYRLMLKMVQRIAQAGGALPPGPTPPASLVFGAFLPSNLTEAVEMVVKLLEAHGISRRTALNLLVEAGVDIGDLVEELEAIDSEDVTAALALAEATGSEQLAAERLGVELPTSTAVPVPTITLPTPTE